MCSTITPIAAPSREGIGTATIDWKRSSSSSGTNTVRGSSKRVLADERRLVAAQRPAGEPLVDAELDLPDEVRVHARGGAQPQPLAAAQVDEAGVAARRLREHVDHAREHALEVRRGGDHADDVVERVALEPDAVELGGEVSGAHRARGLLAVDQYSCR